MDLKKPFNIPKKEAKEAPSLDLSREKTVSTPEKELASKEGIGEHIRQVLAEQEEISLKEKGAPSLTVAPVPVSAPAAQKSVALLKVEKVLEEDMEELYFSLNDAERRMFKQEGERTAREIEKVIMLGKSVAVKVLALIKAWLRLIPGLNKFFIEQEAKIKTDKIININESRK